MLSRALSLATVMLLIGGLRGRPRRRRQNLEAGKSPSQIFAGTCTACHKSPRGLLRTVPAGSLPGFLRQHYTTSSEMASLLSAYLISNGAAERRPPEPKPGQDAKPDEARPAEQADRRGRRRLVRPGEAPDATKPGDDVPAQSASERGPDGRRSVTRLRRGRPGEEPPETDDANTDTSKTDTSKTDGAKTDAAKTDGAKTDAAKTDAAKTDAAKTDAAKDESSKGEPAKDTKPSSDTAKTEDSKPESSKPESSKPEGSKPEDSKAEATKPAGEGGSEAAKIDAPKATGEAPALRADPVPPVTPAPAAAAAPPPAAASSAVPERSPEPPAPAAPSAPHR